jgi:hypothetical protein
MPCQRWSRFLCMFCNLTYSENPLTRFMDKEITAWRFPLLLQLSRATSSEL